MLSGNYNTKISSSMLLWLDNLVTSKCGAYTNYSSKFYPISGQYYNYYTYGVPAKQLVYDQSVNGANAITGVYLNNVFVGTGVSGFLGINYSNGTAIFNQNVSQYPISGDYSAKYFNILLTADNDETILFKNKYYLKPKFSQVQTGLPPDYIEFPIIWLKNDGISNSAFALGGQEWTKSNFRITILADSLYSLNVIEGVLTDTIRTPMALFEQSEMPFNSIGSLVSGSYNYTGAAYKKINEQSFAFIEDVRIPKQSQRIISEIIDRVPARDIYFNFVDITLTRVRQPRVGID